MSGFFSCVFQHFFGINCWLGVVTLFAAAAPCYRKKKMGSLLDRSPDVVAEDLIKMLRF